LDPEIKQQLEVEKEVHLRKAKVFYTNFKLYCEKAKADEFVETLTFDFEQNFPLPHNPHIPSGDVYINTNCGHTISVYSQVKQENRIILCTTKQFRKKGKIMSLVL